MATKKRAAAKRVTVQHAHALPRQPLGARALQKTLAPLIANELASIGAIDSAMPHEREPGYVILLRAAKLGKQANVEQMTSMLRMEGVTQIPPASPIEPVLKLQSATMARLGTTPLLRAMRMAQAAVVAQYEARLGMFSGLLEEGFEKCWRRARKQLVVLTAHIAIRGAKPEIEEQLALPWPLERYFANGAARVCFRCLFDRAGNRAPLERSDPHPYTYVCAACHEEVLGDFPPDLLESAPRWSEREEENRVIERALSRPSKLHAELQVLSELSALAPELPPRPLSRKAAAPLKPRRAKREPDAIAVLDVEETGTLEREYIDRLLDYESVRTSW